MGNRAVITTPDKNLALYLHWNGGRDTVEPLLKYCELQGYRPPSQDCYGWARMAQVVGNFFGGSLSVGIDRYRNLGDQGDNGVYVIDGWKIVDRYATAYDEDWNAIGLRHIDPSAEQSGYDFDEMLHAFDEAMPENLRLGAFLDAEEVPVSDVRLGDKVWMSAYESNPELFEVMGFGADDAPQGLQGNPLRQPLRSRRRLLLERQQLHRRRHLPHRPSQIVKQSPPAPPGWRFPHNLLRKKGARKWDTEAK